MKGTGKGVFFFTTPHVLVNLCTCIDLFILLWSYCSKTLINKYVHIESMRFQYIHTSIYEVKSREHKPEIMTDVGMCHLSARTCPSLLKSLRMISFGIQEKGGSALDSETRNCFQLCIHGGPPTSCKWAYNSCNSRIKNPRKTRLFSAICRFFSSTYDWMPVPTSYLCRGKPDSAFQLINRCLVNIGGILFYDSRSDLGSPAKKIGETNQHEATNIYSPMNYTPISTGI